MNRLFCTCCLMLLCATAPASLTAQNQTTVQNPLIFADVPDVDVICVGEDYYMASTTFQYAPGVPIMHSRDMKHWSVISYVIDRLNDGPWNNLEPGKGNTYGRGQWAPCIRYHEGKYYVFFGTSVHSYLYETEDPRGPWKLRTKFEEYIHDASMLFDDDGRVYLVYGAAKIRLRELKPDLSGFKEGGIDQVLESIPMEDINEGSHVYKINGKYYITTISWTPGSIRTQLCYRSDKITGPYEKQVVMQDDFGFSNHGVAQGAFWKASNNEWYAMLFQDHEGVGRIPFLMPVTWKDGWPMMGDEQGKIPHEFVIPNIPEQGKSYVIGSDDFSGKELSLLWQWNHNPDNSLWSLTERKGWLRLKTGQICSGIMEARNTITQRTEGPYCSGTVKMDVRHMKVGDKAGLMSFCSEPGGLTVERREDGYYLLMTDRDKTCATLPMGKLKKIHLRMECDFITDTAHFLYSLNGRTFKPLGEGFHMVFNLAHFIGNKFAIFNYATQEGGGYVDVDSFIYTHDTNK